MAANRRAERSPSWPPRPSAMRIGESSSSSLSMDFCRAACPVSRLFTCTDTAVVRYSATERRSPTLPMRGAAAYHLKGKQTSG